MSKLKQLAYAFAWSTNTGGHLMPQRMTKNPFPEHLKGLCHVNARKSALENVFAVRTMFPATAHVNAVVMGVPVQD